MQLTIWITLCILNLIIVWIVYQSIYKRLNRTNKSFFWMMKKSFGYYKFTFIYHLFDSRRWSEMDDFLQEQLKKRCVFARAMIFILAYIFIAPLVASCFSIILDSFFWIVLTGLAELSILKDAMVQYRSSLIIYLREFEIFLYQWDQKRKEGLTKRKGNRTKRERLSVGGRTKISKIILSTMRAEDWIVIVIIILSAVLMGIIVKEILDTGLKAFLLDGRSGFFPFQSSLSKIALGILIFLVFTYSFQDRRKKQKVEKVELEEKKIVHSSELDNWDDEIFRMCQELKIDNVRICVELDMKEAFSTIEEKIPIIVIGKILFHYIQQYHKEDQFEMIKMILAHELVHIAYRDTIIIKRKFCYILLLFIFIIVGSGVIISLSSNMVIRSMTLIVFVLVMGISWRVVCEEKYWKQVMELRADRIGFAVSGISYEIFEKVLNCASSNTKKSFAKERNILYKYYENYIAEKDHPSNERRLKEIERGKRWSSIEYIRYILLIRWNLLRKRGWNFW